MSGIAKRGNLRFFLVKLPRGAHNSSVKRENRAKRLIAWAEIPPKYASCTSRDFSKAMRARRALWCVTRHR